MDYREEKKDIKTRRKELLLKVALLFFAIVFAVLISELITRYVIRFPTFGVKKYVIGLDPRGFDKNRVYKPNSLYYTSENGFQVFRHNNIGLKGNNVNPNYKNIFMLGSSYVEAAQVHPKLIASSVVNNYTQKLGYQVINIGYQGCTPYEQYCRLKYYSATYPPSLVVLVLDSTYDGWYKHWSFKQIDPTTDSRFGLESKVLSHELYRIGRNSSAMINLAVPAIKSRNKKANDDGFTPDMGNTPGFHSDYSAILNSIKLIDEASPKLVVVSFIRDLSVSKTIGDKLASIGVPYFHRDLKTRDNVLVGHFNEKGNRELGEFIIEILKTNNYLD